MSDSVAFDGPTEIVQTTNLGTPTAFCSVHDIHAYYGESYIVQGVSFNIHEGEILALLGRNGAGKTSTLRSIARCDDPQVMSGEIWLDHQPLHVMKPFEAAQNGVSLVPEDRRIISGLSVEENLILAQIEEPVGWGIDRIYDLFPRLKERRNQEGITLSVVSSKCWPLVGRWPAILDCCCLMSPMRAWRLSLCKRLSGRSETSNSSVSRPSSLSRMRSQHLSSPIDLSS